MILSEFPKKWCGDKEDTSAKLASTFCNSSIFAEKFLIFGTSRCTWAVSSKLVSSCIPSKDSSWALLPKKSKYSLLSVGSGCELIFEAKIFWTSGDGQLREDSRFTERYSSRRDHVHSRSSNQLNWLGNLQILRRILPASVLETKTVVLVS